MGGLLPLGGIAALVVLGFVVWVNAFTSNPPAESDWPRDRALARERRRLRREQLRRQAQQASSAGRRGVRAVAWRAMALADEWLPRLRHHAHDARVRWPTSRLDDRAIDRRYRGFSGLGVAHRRARIIGISGRSDGGA